MVSAVTAVLYILKDIAAVFNLLMIMRFVFLEKLRISAAKSVFFTLLITANSAAGIFLLKNTVAEYDSVMDFVSQVIYIFILIFMTERVSKKRIILTVFVCVFTVDMLWALVSSYAGANLIIEYSVNIVLYSAACAAVYYICIKSKTNILPEAFGGIPSWVFVALLLFELTCYYKEFGVSAQWYKALYFLSVAGIVLCLFYMLFKISLMAFKQNEILNQMQLQKEMFEKQSASDEELRRFRHDYKNHMIVIGSLLSGGKTEEAADYAKKLGNITGETKFLIRTGNPAADVLLNQKKAEAEKVGIKTEFIGFIPTGLIDDMDICTVLSNLVDNAVEAAEKCKSDRIIKIEANLVNSHFLLTVTNPYVTVQKDKKGRLKTTKADKINHGIGMKNIERIVEKYNGAIFTEQEYSVFTSNIRMKIKPKKDI